MSFHNYYYSMTIKKGVAQSCSKKLIPPRNFEKKIFTSHRMFASTLVNFKMKATITYSVVNVLEQESKLIARAEKSLQR